MFHFKSMENFIITKAQYWLPLALTQAIINPELALEIHQGINNQRNALTLRLLEDVLREVNPFIPLYQIATELIENYVAKHTDGVAYLQPNLNLKVEFTTNHNVYNLPERAQIVALLPPNFATLEATECNCHHVLLHNCNHTLTRIDPSVAMYMPTHYVLLFLLGDLDYYYGLVHVRNNPTAAESVSIQEYYCYCIFLCNAQPKILFYACCLFQQFLADAWA
ncbi:hypothetical protein DSO57_1023107 [Entomophthora muscae]|uniref:Uncharacterized protein n=1 Tax=Entomophthora muscae TaxID=34485 RepID=A0ACC2U1B8_9FUNG|nr:hypothetical protein DSO57_1023107 [Entomophthora muscae]